MPEYQVKAFIEGRGVLEGRVLAADLSAIASALGLPAEQVLSVKLVDTSRPARRRSPFPLRLFGQDLAMLLDAGIPLLEAIQGLREKEMRQPVAATLDALITRLRDGQSLSAAFAADQETFGEVLPAVTAASEQAGQLPSTLRQHAEYLAWTESLRARLVAAATYPALLLLVGGAVVLFLLTFVLPRFAGVLEGVGTELPWASRQLISLGHVAGEHPLVLTIAIIVSVLALIGAARSPAVLRLASALAWRSPWLGTHLYAIALARLYRTLGMLTCAGIPVLQALGIARGTLSPHLQPAIQDVELHVSQGRRLSESLQLQGLTTPVSRRMIEVGERSGSLPTMLGRAASFHDEEIARFIDFVTRIVNPTLMLVMGVVIGGIVVLMYLPIFQLVEQVQ